MLLNNYECMRQIIYLLLIFLMCSCSSEDILYTRELKYTSQSGLLSDIKIEINTTRDTWNMLDNPSGSHILKSTSSDPFTEIKDVECTESVVLPELVPHIWVGNIMKKNSIADCIYQPLIYPRSPINIGMTLPGTIPKQIVNPTSLNYLSYIQEQTAKGSFTQSNEFNFTIEQFTSYNELKVAFGSNVNTNMIFWGSSSSTERDEHRIDKATGLYVKFYQTSYKTYMDYPQGSIAQIPSDMVNEAVYINSITYGRLGIMTLETNSTAEYSKEVMNRTFNKLFVSGSSSLTSEEQSFLNGCDFKVYLIGGNGSTAVQSFTGYAGFIQHIKKGTFSKNEPGAPLFCTFNHVKDNSPVKVNFKFSMKKQPLYVEFKEEGEWLQLKFYNSRSKVPVIADPRIGFKTQKLAGETHSISGGQWWETRVIHDISKTFYNSGYQTSLKLYKLSEISGYSCSNYSMMISLATYSRCHVKLFSDDNIVILGNDFYGDKIILYNKGDAIYSSYTGCSWAER